jgi:hypothetical protein
MQREPSTNTDFEGDDADDLRPEYDLTTFMQRGVRGKYVDRYRAGTNLALLEPDVARAFPDDAAVNQALRLVMQLAQLPARKPAAPVSE